MATLAKLKHLRTKNVKTQVSSPTASQIARWQMILTEYDIQYTMQKAIKGSVLADHLSHQVVDDYQSMNFYFPDENIMLVTTARNLDHMTNLNKDPDGLWSSMGLPTPWVTKLVL